MTSMFSDLSDFRAASHRNERMVHGELDSEEISDDDSKFVMSVLEWREALQDGMFTPDDGF